MKRKKKKKSSIPCFVFTPETLAITQEALKLFEQPLQRVDQQSSKVALLEETIKQVQGKLDAMSTSVGALCLFTFDANEKLVIALAIQLFLLDLDTISSGPQRERKLKQCRQIERFASGHLT
jgi:hypothetical protein